MESLYGIHSSQRRSVLDTTMRFLTGTSNFNNINFTSIQNKQFMNLCEFPGFLWPCSWGPR